MSKSTLFNTTELANHFGVSYLVMDGKLVDLDLCDKNHYKATEFALNNGYVVNEVKNFNGKIIHLDLFNEKSIIYINKELAHDVEFIADKILVKFTDIIENVLTTNDETLRITYLTDDIEHIFSPFYHNEQLGRKILNQLEKETDGKQMRHLLNNANFYKNFDIIVNKLKIEEKLNSSGNEVVKKVKI